MKLEQLEGGTWMINGVEYAPVEKQPPELSAQPIDPDQMPVRFTMRDGTHWTAIRKDAFAHGWIEVIQSCSRCASQMSPNNKNIIYVGKWLTLEELEAMRNE